MWESEDIELKSHDELNDNMVGGWYYGTYSWRSVFAKLGWKENPPIRILVIKLILFAGGWKRY